MKRVAYIDSDSIVYIIAYNHKDSPEEIIKTVCDSFLRDILKAVEATHYLGSFSASLSFRDALYKVDKYKGNRPEKPEWIQRLGPVIKEHFISKHGFVQPEFGIEADDVMLGVSSLLPDQSIICSPDKDLCQIPGLHYDYKNPENGVSTISSREASYNFWLQMLTGDSVDNIKGVPGIGEVKAAKMLENLEELDMMFLVQSQYLKYYGPYYGDLIYKETYSAVSLLSSTHPSITQEQAAYFESLAQSAIQEYRSDL